MPKDIELAIACGQHSEAYVALLLHTAIHTVSSQHRLKFLLGISHKKVNIAYLKNLSKYADLEIFDVSQNLPYCSYAHGLALDKTFRKITSPYAMILDCDIAFLEKNWDLTLKDQLDKNHVIIGTAYDEKYDKFCHFPTIFAALFHSQTLKNCKISFTPALSDTDNPLSPLKKWHLNPDNAGYFGRKDGDTITLDTSWELPYKLRKNHFEGIPIQPVPPGDPRSKLLKPHMRGQEYHFNHTPFFTHLGRSSKRFFGINPYCCKWEKEIRKWLLNKHQISIPKIPSPYLFSNLRKLYAHTFLQSLQTCKFLLKVFIDGNLKKR